MKPVAFEAVTANTAQVGQRHWFGGSRYDEAPVFQLLQQLLRGRGDFAERNLGQESVGWNNFRPKKTRLLHVCLNAEP